MADPLTLGLVLAGTGALKGATIDRAKEDRQRKLRATQEQFSGWSKQAPTQQIQEADPFGSALTYGSTGASLGQGLQKSAAETDLMKKMAAGGGADNTTFALNSGGSDYFNKPYQYNPWGGGSSGFGGGL